MYEFMVTKLNERVTLKKGARAFEVGKLQTLLKDLRYYTGKIDNDFGRLTFSAVYNYQRDNNLKYDGWAGAKTLYSLMWKAYPNFSESEFNCKCGGRFCDGKPHRVDEENVRNQQLLRDHFGKPVHIASGLRCEKYNAEVGGVSDSMHLVGKAADVIITSVAPAKVQAYCQEYRDLFRGLGIYKTFTHTDTGEKRTW